MRAGDFIFSEEMEARVMKAIVRNSLSSSLFSARKDTKHQTHVFSRPMVLLIK